MTVSKRIRFEIFKRDGFTCQYCGRKPPEVVLEVDHIHPRAEGGDDDEANLVTSCVDCNRGKGAKTLKEYSPRTDVDLAWLEVQQELAELKRYNEMKAARDAANDEACRLLKEHWQHHTRCTLDVPDEQMFRYWLREFGPDEVEYAINVMALRHEQQPFYSLNGMMRYVGGVLWKRRRGESR